MLRFCIHSIVTELAFCALAPLLSAQTGMSPALPPSIPNLSGVWDNTHLDLHRGGPSEGPPGGFVGPGDIPTFGFTREEPEMLPWAKERYSAARYDLPRGLLDRGKDALDPIHSCFPPGPTRAFTNPSPWELFQFPDAVVLLFEFDHQVRRIYVDGRGHPAGFAPSWMGHSIGRYDGDSLLADTVKPSPRTWLDAMGHPQTESLRISERFRLSDPDTLQIDFTFDDPETYVRPWTGKKIFLRAPPRFEVLESTLCEEWLEMGTHHGGGD
jgi:hypothetical protein